MLLDIRRMSSEREREGEEEIENKHVSKITMQKGTTVNNFRKDDDMNHYYDNHNKLGQLLSYVHNLSHTFTCLKTR